jgi:hypothetical protein
MGAKEGTVTVINKMKDAKMRDWEQSETPLNVLASKEMTVGNASVGLAYNRHLS